MYLQAGERYAIYVIVRLVSILISTQEAKQLIVLYSCLTGIQRTSISPRYCINPTKMWHVGLTIYTGVASDT